MGLVAPIVPLWDNLDQGCCRICRNSCLPHPALPFLSNTRPGYLGDNKVRRSTREGTDSYSDEADFLLLPSLPLLLLPILFRGKEKIKNHKQMLMMEKKSTFFFIFHGWGVNAIGRLLCEEMLGGTIYQREYNAPRLKLMIAI